MSMPKQHKIYGVWIGIDRLGYEIGKAYYITISIYPNDPSISIISKNDTMKVYPSFITFLFDWKFIRRLNENE